MGDCNRSGDVSIDELVRSVRIALGEAVLGGCRSGDIDSDARITIDEIVVGVHAALVGCQIAPEAGTRVVGTASAGDLARLLGIDSYRYEITTATGVRVTPLDARGQELGTVDLGGVPGQGTKAEFHAPDGGMAGYTSRAAGIDGSSDVSVHTTLSGGGRSLDRIATTGPGAMSLRDLVLSTPLPPGAALPSLGEGVSIDSGVVAELLVIDAGQMVATAEQVNEWQAEAGVAALLESRPVQLLDATLADPNLAAALRGELEDLALALPSAPDAGSGAIHLSPVCSLVLGVATAGVAAVCCPACITAAAALPVTAGWSAILALPSCICCEIAIGVGLTEIAACVISYLRRHTQQDCNMQAQAWQTCAVNRDEHGCDCTCDSARCEGFCRDLATEQEAQFCGTNACQGNTCRCRICSDDICREFFPEKDICFSQCREGRCGCAVCDAESCRSRRGDACCDTTCDRRNRRCLDLVARCGDGIVTARCPLNPARAEECDGVGQAQCFEGFECVECRCVQGPPPPTPTRTPTRTRTLTPTLTPLPRPTATPTPDTGGRCGNGLIELGEQCDPPGSQCIIEGLICGPQCTCGAPSFCGNFLVDPGEFCDPPGSPCPVGGICAFNCGGCIK